MGRKPRGGKKQVPGKVETRGRKKKVVVVPPEEEESVVLDTSEETPPIEEVKVPKRRGRPPLDKNKNKECSTSTLKTVAPEPVPAPTIQIVQETQDTEMVELIAVDDDCVIVEDPIENLGSAQISLEKIETPSIIEIRTPIIHEEDSIIYIDEDSLPEPPIQKIQTEPVIVEREEIPSTSSFQQSIHEVLIKTVVEEQKNEVVELIDDEPIEIPEVKDEKVEEINKQLENCVLELAPQDQYPSTSSMATEEIPEKAEIEDEVKDEVKPEDFFLDSIDDESNDMTSLRVRRSTRLKSSASRHHTEPDWSSVATPLPRSILNIQQSELSTYTNMNPIESPVLSPNPSISSLSQSFRPFSPEMKVKTRWRKCAELEEQVLQEIGQVFVDPEPDDTQQISQDEIDKINDEIKVDPNDDRLSHFVTIRDNIYLSTKVVCKINKTMKCDCTISEEEIRRGEMGCGENCINRLLYIECGQKCRCGEFCDNRQFQRFQYSECVVFRTEKKGFGIKANQDIESGSFIIEYVGEVLSTKIFEKRAKLYSKEKNKHYYFMALRANAIIDATSKGNISRFINHSCDPCAMTQKWTVNGELRVGFFSTRDIQAGEEITFDYQFQRYGKEAQKCYCEALSCRGWIGEQPISEEEEDNEEFEESPKIKLKAKKTKAKSKAKAKLAVSVETVEEQTIEEDESADDLIDPDDSEDETVSQEDIKKPLKKREISRKFADKKKKQDRFDDMEIEGEISYLLKTGLKNRTQTVRLSRLIVRSKNVDARSRLLKILLSGDMPCQRLFLDYNGLKLLYNWMSEVNIKNSVYELNFCLEMIDALTTLPITNKTVLRDSKVLGAVEKWSNLDINLEEKKKMSKEEKKLLKSEEKQKKKDKLAKSTAISSIVDDINVDSLKAIIDNCDKMKVPAPEEVLTFDVMDELMFTKLEVKKAASQLLKTWEVLKEDFRIPRKKKFEQMKQHERDADLTDPNYHATSLIQDMQQVPHEDRYRGRYQPSNQGNFGAQMQKRTEGASMSKYHRRQLFEQQMAKADMEKKTQEMTLAHEKNCHYFGVNPIHTPPIDIPICMNPFTMQYFTIDNRLVPQPPNHPRFNIQIPPMSTNPADYHLPPIDLPEHWKYAIDDKGRIYYYHIKIRDSQWEPPIKLLPLEISDDENETYSNESTTETEDTSEDELIQTLKMLEKKKLKNIQKISLSLEAETSFEMMGEEDLELKIMNNMLSHPVDQPMDIAQSPNALNVVNPVLHVSPDTQTISHKKKKSRRGLVQTKLIKPRTEEDKLYGISKMKHYKEVKEKLRRERRRQASLGKSSDGSKHTTTEEDTDTSFNDSGADLDDSLNNSLASRTIIDELDILTKNQLRRKTIETKMRNPATPSSSEQKKKPKPEVPSSINNLEHLKQVFRDELKSDVARFLLPYKDEHCRVGRIRTDDHYHHLVNKITYSVLLKESKHCENTTNALKATDSVKGKTREYIKKYMAKFGKYYEKAAGETDYGSILNKI